MLRPTHVGDAINQEPGGHWVGHYGPYELRSAFQPIYRPIGMRKYEIFGFEGLVRVSRDGVGVAPVNLFASVQPADSLFVEAMCMALHIRNSASLALAGRKLFLNLDPSHYTSTSVAEQEFGFALDAMPQYGLSPRDVFFEILEVQAPEEKLLRRVASMLRERGVSLALDDFGVGSSDLARYRSLWPDLVKLDLTLFQALARSEPARQLMRSLTERFHDNATLVLAEGVETPDMLACGRQLDLDFLQGYLFCRPQHAPYQFPSNWTERPGREPPVFIEQPTALAV